MVTSRLLDAATGAEVFLKAENLQRTGSFKIRGAYNTVASLSEEERSRGVVAFSSGNHAQAVAHACELAGVEATIVMPTDAPPNKRAATEGYGATIVEYDRFTEDRQAIALEISERTGACLVPPFDHREILAGQGTCGLELAEQVPGLDIVFICVGGGGLMAGCATALTSLQPGVEIRGVEPAAADDTFRSFAAGHPVEIPQPDTIADGLAPRRPGDMTFEINQRLASGIDLVAEEEIATTMGFLFERLKLVVEPSGATALAAVMSGRVPVEGRRVGVTLTGGNIDANRFAEIIARFHDDR